MTTDARLRIAVIGAGMAGLACAASLHAGGAAVTLFDKARRPGGRLASRRVAGLRFDHGAQYATARGPAFQAFLADAPDLVAPWDRHAAHPRWVGIPGMSAFAVAAERHGIGRLLSQRHVSFVSHRVDGWHLRHLDAAEIRPGTVIDEGEQAGPYDRIVLAMPAPQAAGLLAVLDHRFASVAAAIEMQPCWALMLAYSAGNQGPDTRELERGPLGWIARDSSRPGRPALPEGWVAHATPEWSRANLEQPPDAVLSDLCRAFTDATTIVAAPIHAAVHRWRYARAARPLGEDCLWDPQGLAVCGDWCLGARVEAAFDSGRAAATRCLEHAAEKLS